MVMRFVIGQTSEPAQEAELVAESYQYGGFMRLHLQVQLLAPVSVRLQLLQFVHTYAFALVKCIHTAEACLAAAGADADQRTAKITGCLLVIGN